MKIKILSKSMYITLTVIILLFLFACSNTVSSKESGSLSSESAQASGDIPSAESTPSPEATDNQEDGNMIVLQNDRIKVEICKPGIEYTASRFDWAGIIKQVTLDGEHTFLSRENPSKPNDKTLGIGIISAFEPTISKLNKVKYSYEKTNDTTVVFTNKTEDSEPDIKFIKTVKLEGTKVIITHEITNNTGKKLNVTEYNHNFFQIDEKAAGPDYELSFPYTPVKSTPTSGLHNLFTINENIISWSRELTTEPKEEDCLMQIKGFDSIENAEDLWWKLIYKPTGVGVKETQDFSIYKFQLWNRKYCICPEVFFKGSAQDSETINWTRSYEFFTGDDS